MSEQVIFEGKYGKVWRDSWGFPCCESINTTALAIEFAEALAAERAAREAAEGREAQRYVSDANQLRSQLATVTAELDEWKSHEAAACTAFDELFPEGVSWEGDHRRIGKHSALHPQLLKETLAGNDAEALRRTLIVALWWNALEQQGRDRNANAAIQLQDQLAARDAELARLRALLLSIRHDCNLKPKPHFSFGPERFYREIDAALTESEAT